VTGAAIVGMACVFPGAPDLETYWHNILRKLDATGDPPADWDAERVYEPGTTANDRIYCRRGGFLGDLARFDPAEHGVMPNSVDGGEPDQFLALKVARDALEDAGHFEHPVDGERCEVVIGRGTYINRGFVTVVQHALAVEQALELLRRVHPEHDDETLAALKAELPPFNADMAAGLVPNVMSGRIANRFDFKGPNFTIDAACASSLIALERATQDLAAGRCDLALVGGVHCSTPAPILMIFCQLDALSRRERLRPFDERADGTVLGEGLGFVVLKRAEDAERDGHRVYAVVTGVGSSSDGRGVGLLAPRPDGEELALRRAYELAGVEPATVGLLEAHGTGTPVGDAAEIEAIRRVFGERNGSPPRCAIGCVKSMIGHLIPAAGMAGLIKTALALHHKVLPPTIGCEQPDPKHRLETAPFYINGDIRPWIHGGATPRRAGVNAFGFGGINAHALLEESPVAPGDEPASGAPGWDAELFVLQADTAGELASEVARLQEELAEDQAPEFADLARRQQLSLEAASPQRLAIVATSPGELGERLSAAATLFAEPGRTQIRDPRGIYWFAEPLGHDGGTAFLFPGEGSQYPGMLADVSLHFPEARRWFDLIDRVFEGADHRELPSDFIFPAPGTSGRAERLFDMDGAGESLFAAEQAMLAVLAVLGVRPDAVVGHSSGEYSALLAAGAIRFGDEAALVASTRRVNALFRELSDRGAIPRASLVAVASADRQGVEQLVSETDRVHLAMDNCPHQVVISGTDEAVETVVSELGARGAVCSPVPFDRPYHTPAFAPFSEALAGLFADLDVSAPSVPLYSCATAARVPDDPDVVRRLAAQQWSQRVRFRETVEAMYADGVRLFVEVGPGAKLCGFVEDALRGRPAAAIPVDVEGRRGPDLLMHCLALLTAHGLTPSFDRLHERRDTPAARPAAPEPPLVLALPRLRLDRLPAPAPAALPASAAPAQNTVVEAYLATMTRFVESQQRVMLEALGGAAPARAPFLREILQHVPGESLTALCELSLDEDVYLLDHTLETGVLSAADPDLTGLPIVPLTVSIEVLAEAAAALAPGRMVTGMRDVTASRWLALDAGRLPLLVRAARGGEPDEVSVKLWERESPDGPPAVEATVLLGERRAPVARANGFPLRDERLPALKGEDLYGGTAMFHGPAFQVVSSLDRVGSDGIEATLTLPGAPLPLASDAAPDLQADPVALDAMGQVVAYWAVERFDRATNVFPYRLERLELHDGGRVPGERTRCRVRVRGVDESRMRSDVELIGHDGTVLVRMAGWEDRRLDVPQPIRELFAAPAAVRLSRAWPSALEHLAGSKGLRCRLLDAAGRDFLRAHGEIWLRALAHVVLSRRERDRWRELADAPVQRRLDWLWGRIAAKDAVRELVDEPLPPADVEIAVDEQGRPSPNLPASPDAGLTVSIAHGAGVAAAVAGPAGTHLGIDLESVDAVGATVERVAFGAPELELLEALPGRDRAERLARGWCAKEAAGKASGRGLAGDPRTLEITAAEATGAVTLALEGRMARVVTGRDGDLAFAVCCIEREDTS
jgi:acyl transferase domain-containing protein/phosphopantetheinyl transferase